MCAPPGAPMIAPSTAINAPIAPLSMVAPMTPNTIAVMAPPNAAAAGCFLIAASGSTVLSEVSTFILHPLSLRINPNHVRASGKLSDSRGIAGAATTRRPAGYGARAAVARAIPSRINFFANYKDLEDRKWVKLLGWGNVDEAKKLILDGIARATAARAT